MLRFRYGIGVLGNDGGDGSVRDDPGRRGDPDPYEDDTQVVRQRRIEPEPDIVEERYVEPAPVVDRYVEERRVGRPVYEERVTERRAVHDRGHTLSRIARAIYFIFGVIESLIAIRVVLRLLAANRNNPFAELIYGLTGPFVAPFQGLFGSEPNFGQSVFEFSSLAAIVVYALLAFALVRLLYLFSD
jgi:uncharacterized protein YggT (Ycf19 family)